MNNTAYNRSLASRQAKSAFAALPGISTYINLEGDGRSTLCPVPQTVFPVSEIEKSAQWGCIVFDTYMDPAYSANDAVTPKSGVCGTRNWGTDAIGSFFVDFQFSDTGVTLEAVSNKCTSATSSGVGRPLDGDGVAPMPVGGQSKTWSW